MSDDGKKKGFGASLVKGFGMAKQFTMQKMGKAHATTESTEFTHGVAQMRLSTNQLRELLNRTQALLKSHRQAIQQYQGFGGSVARLLQSHEEKAPAADKEGLAEKVGRLSVVDSPIGHICTNFHPYSLQIIAHRERLLTAYETLLIAPLEEILNNECAQAAKLVSKLETDRLDYDAKNGKVEAAKEKGKPVDSKDAHAADVAKMTYDQTVQQITEKCKAIDVKKHGIMTHNLIQIQKAEQEYYASAATTLSSQLSGASIAMVAVPASATSVEEDYAAITSDTEIR